MSDILIEQDGNIGIVTLNRPDHMNALTAGMIKDLTGYFSEAEQDDSIRSIILTGTGRAFSTGADLAGGAGREDVQTPMGMKLSTHLYFRVFYYMNTIEKPIVTAINGTAAGAAVNLALGGDIIVAAQGVKFIEVFARRGMFPDAGGCYILPRLVGLPKAKELMFFGDNLLAEDALAIGLVNKVVPSEKLMEAAMEYAERLAKGPTRALGMMKKMLNRSFEMNIQEAMDYEAAFQGILASTEDVREGVMSFFEKRPPEFKGK
ncbi:MAG: enoyl-CoA hydratase/isomerase family protein [Deltaproteobacteria bacterium]|nr:enoyl-CoA hydratase/isomerase family protein [Candidatus Zymogenaceae bacterium]